MKRRLALLMLLVALAACRRKVAVAPLPPPPAPAPPPPPQSIIALLPDAPDKVGRITVSNPAGAQELATANTAVRIANSATAPTAPAALDPSEIRRLFGAALAVVPAEELTFNLYFVLGSTALAPESEALLPSLLQAVRERRNSLVFVTGHTDSTGTSRQANRTLGLQRAEAMAQRLRAIGVSPELIITGSHGQDDPLVPTPPNTPEPRNRRVEVVLR